MLIRLKNSRAIKWIVLAAIMLPIGCYKPPTAQQLDYDADTVETLRQEIKSVDWDA